MRYLVFEDVAGTRTTHVLDRLHDAPASLTLAALVLVVLLVIATKAWSGSRDAAAWRAAVGARGDSPFAAWVAVTYLVGDQHRFIVSSLTFIIALLVAQTRVESGIHTPLEVVYGGALGALVTLVDLPGCVVNDLLDEQKRYYAARAPEYDDWWYRRDRYELEPDALARWWDDVAEADAALEAFAPLRITCSSSRPGRGSGRASSSV